MKRHASMNRLYRTLWSEAKQAFVVVAEIAKGHPKPTGHHDLQDKLPHDVQPGFVLARHSLPFSIRQLLGISLLGFASTVMAEPAFNAVPTGGQITQGSGSISQTGNTLNVQQTSDKMVGQWNSFDIGQQATVNFQQPNAESIALNRINDSKPSEIYGKLNANGQVYLLNANGVIFGKTAQVDVGGLVASTQKLSDENFQNGKTHFEANGSTGSIDNQGQINAHGGVVVFIAPQVKNSGSINNPGGNVVMAAGEQVSLDFDGDGLITVKVDKAAVDALADNKGLIRADGGAVVMSAQSANALMNTVVNNDGVIQAKSLQNHHGRIILDGGDQGQTTNAGTLDVSSNTAQGGQIQVTAEHIVLDNGAKLDASGATAGGEVLVGGDWQGSGTLKQATTVNMKQGASINVSAKTHGNGGKAVLWSDVSKTESRTIVQGSIVAKGGAISGNGGRIETSGHQVDIAGANISAGADWGHGGLWLIDPYDYSVDATVADYISAALTAGTSVTIDTASSPTAINGYSVAGTGNIGDITVSAAIAKTGGTEATLTLKAARHIALQSGANISSSSDKLNTVLWSDTDANGGYVQLAGSASITTNGGGLWIGGGSGSSTWTPYTGASFLTVGNGFATGTSSYATGVYLGYGAISTTGGNVAIFGKTATTGSVTSQPSPDTSQWHSGIYSINSGGTANQTASINAGSGSIYLNGVNQLTSNVGGEGMYLNGITLTSSATSGDAITLIGSSATANYGGGTRGAGVTMIGWANQPVSLNATGGGNIVINGTSSAVSSSYNYGVRVSSAGATTQITTTNGGNIFITGTANDTNALYSVAFETATDSITSTGNLSITGINNTGSAKPINLAGPVRVFGTTDLTAGLVDDIELINGGNDFTGGVRVVRGNNVSLTDANSISLGAASLSGNLTVNALGGNVNLNGNLTSIGSGAAILVKGTGDIVQDSSVIVTTSNGTVTYNSDSDANHDGAIFVKNGSQINTYGGDIVMGGGANPTTTAAYGSVSHIDGIALFNVDNPFDGITPATINAGGGNISLIGHGRDGGGGTNAGFGINSNMGVTIQTVGSGTIDLKGTGGSGGSGVSGGYGVVLDRTSVQAVDGKVDIQGTVQLSSAYAVTMLEGNVSQLNGVITTGIGNINISGAGGNGLQFGFGRGPTLGSGSAEGDITLRSDKVQIDGSTDVTVNTSGSVLIQPISSSFDGALNTTYLTLDSRISGLRLGRAGNTASIVLGGVTSIAGSISIYGGDINLNQNLGSTAAGDVLLKGSGVLTIASGKAINTSNGNITLTASRFVNSSGASALSAGGTGTHWQVWSSNADPFNGSTGDVRGGLAYNYKQYGATYGSSTVLGTGNGLLYTYAPTLTASLTGSVTKAYDGGTTATLLAGNYATNAVDGDTVTLNNPTSGSYTSLGTAAVIKDVGTGKTVQASGVVITSATKDGATIYGYTLSSGTASGSVGTITKKTVTLSASKVYDGTTSLTDNVTIGGLIGSEALTCSGATAYDAHVATANKYINAITLADGTGGLASNYQLPTLDNANAPVTITVATLTPTITNTGVTKVFDGLAAAPADFTPSWSFSGLASNDSAATLSYSGAIYNDPNVGFAKTLTVSGLLITGITGSNSSASSDYFLDATSKSLTAAITGINAFTSISASLLSTQSTSNASLLSTANGRNTADAGQLLTLMGDSLFADFTIGTGGRMTLAGDNGTTPVHFSQSGQSLTLLFEGGKSVKAAETLLRLPIFVRAGENVRVTGSFNVLDDGRGLTLSLSEPAGERVPSLAELNPTTLSTRYAVNVGDGTGLILEMALSSEHMLIIRKMGGSATLDEKQLTLLGLSAAKANMSVTFKVLKGVVII